MPKRISALLESRRCLHCLSALSKAVSLAVSTGLNVRFSLLESIPVLKCSEIHHSLIGFAKNSDVFCFVSSVDVFFEPVCAISISVGCGFSKIAAICKEIYGANGVEFTTTAKNQMAAIKRNGWDNLPICIAKTQYSLSDNPKLLARPTNFTITIRELKPSIGAGFIVALSGDIMTMPGLPKEPAANKMDVIDGKTVGLF